MKLVHDSHSAYVDSRLERLASGRRRRRLRRHEPAPVPGDGPHRPSAKAKTAA